jgi:hypothetical protein
MDSMEKIMSSTRTRLGVMGKLNPFSRRRVGGSSFNE